METDTKFEFRTCKMTDDDIRESEETREQAYARIGEIAVEKAKATAKASADTKTQMKIVDAETGKLDSGEHEVRCRVVVDLYEGKARYYRGDTGEWVYSRDLYDYERQQPMVFSAAPPTNTASETAKKKSPGLKETATATPAAVPAATIDGDISDELRASVLAEVGDSERAARVLLAVENGWNSADAVRIAKSADPKVELLAFLGGFYSPALAECLEGEWLGDSWRFPLMAERLQAVRAIVFVDAFPDAVRDELGEKWLEELRALHYTEADEAGEVAGESDLLARVRAAKLAVESHAKAKAPRKNKKSSPFPLDADEADA